MTEEAVQGDGLVRTPPMGWMSWNAFGRDLPERAVRRSAGDIQDSWSGPGGIVTVAEATDPLADWAGPGHWNDPDMLVTGLRGRSQQVAAGTTGCTDAEYRTQLSLWAMPLHCSRRATCAPPMVRRSPPSCRRAFSRSIRTPSVAPAAESRASMHASALYRIARPVGHGVTTWQLSASGGGYRLADGEGV